MTIKEYKDKFIELANQMEQEHGIVRNITINCEIITYGGALDKSIVNVSRKDVIIDF